MVFPLKGYLLHCTILIAYFGLSKVNIAAKQHIISATQVLSYKNSINPQLRGVFLGSI
jgi:hypothetical protein